MRRCPRLRLSTHALLFLTMAAGCGGRSTLIPHDQATPSGSRANHSGGAAGGAVTGSGTSHIGGATGGATPMGGTVADAGISPDTARPADAALPVDRHHSTPDAGKSPEDTSRRAPCPPASFDDGLPATPCRPWTNCRPGQYVGAEGTPLLDRKCLPCPAASFSTAENAANCTPWRACDGWDQAEKTAGGATSDRVCTIADGIRVTGTDQYDLGESIAVDNQGNVIIVGNTNGALAGPVVGGYDAFVRKFDSHGDVAWTRQFGTDREDQAFAVAVDKDGGIFVAGETGGTLEGTSNGEVDAFVRKYDRDGAVAWTRQFGTANWDHAYAVAVDAKGNATVAGGTNDYSLVTWPFLRTYAPNGELVRNYDLGLPSSTIPYGVAVDAQGNTYLAGATNTELEGPRAGGFDAFLMKLDAEGHVTWTRQYGTTNTDEAMALALDRDGTPWVAGYQDAQSIPGYPRSGDGFVRRYDSRGTLIFSYSIEDGWWDGANGIAVDNRGHGFVIGTQDMYISDPVGRYDSHIYLQELDSEGTLIGPVTLPKPNQASGGSVAVGPSGGVYVLLTPCNSPFGGHRVVGQCDAFVVQVR